MKLIDQWLEKIKSKSREQKRKEISESFQLREKDGMFGIEHNQDIIFDFDNKTTLEEVKEKLWLHRKTAIKYHGL